MLMLGRCAGDTHRSGIAKQLASAHGNVGAGPAGHAAGLAFFTNSATVTLLAMSRVLPSKMVLIKFNCLGRLLNEDSLQDLWCGGPGLVPSFVLLSIIVFPVLQAPAEGGAGPAQLRPPQGQPLGAALQEEKPKESRRSEGGPAQEPAEDGEGPQMRNNIAPKVELFLRLPMACFALSA